MSRRILCGYEQPFVHALRREDDGHPVVYRRDDRVRLSCKDGECADLRRRFGVEPGFIQPREEHQFAIGRVEPDRAACFFRACPLEEAVGGDDASPSLERVAERRTRQHGFTAGVDLLEGPLRIRRPAVHEPPLRGQHVTVLVLRAHDPVRVRWRDVVSRPVQRSIVGLDGRTERAGKPREVASGQSESSAHLACSLLIGDS